MAFSRVESLNTEFFVSLYIFSNSLSSIEPTVSRDILLEYRSPTEVSLAISDVDFFLGHPSLYFHNSATSSQTATDD